MWSKICASVYTVFTHLEPHETLCHFRCLQYLEDSLGFLTVQSFYDWTMYEQCKYTQRAYSAIAYVWEGSKYGWNWTTYTTKPPILWADWQQVRPIEGAASACWDILTLQRTPKAITNTVLASSKQPYLWLYTYTHFQKSRGAVDKRATEARWFMKQGVTWLESP